MKINASLFTVKDTIEFKSQSLVDYLYSIYEKNFEIIDQIFLNTLMNQKKFKKTFASSIHLELSSDNYVPDINVEMNFLSPFTVDVEMHYKDKKLEKIRYCYFVKFRLFIDAKILEVKETGFDQSSYSKVKESEEEILYRSNNQKPIQDKLTKSLLVNGWFNKLVRQEYRLNKT